MSTFKVSVERIGKIYPHPNADKLELAQVDGMTFQFCVRKDDFKVGDEVVYFPVDSVLPKELIEYLGIGNMLAGKDKNRLKTVKLRGEISQGFVVAKSKFFNLTETFVGCDVTRHLGVTKYEPPEVPCHAGNLIRHPDGVASYDIEGCDRYPQVVEALLPLQVFITEKMEGSNHYSTILPDNSIIVGQRHYQIKPIDGATHDWWATAERFNHFEILKELKQELKVNQLTIRSEICGPGIQDNIYGFSHLCLFAFDFLADGKYLNPKEFMRICTKYNLMNVPILATDVKLKDWLGTMSLQQASHGNATLTHVHGVWREGIVIKPMIEQEFVGLPENRLMLKQRDPLYCDKYDK